MPGISDSPQVAINTAPIAAIGSEQPVTPALNDFMQAFRSGFITVDDLTRRAKQSAVDTSNLQTTLSANDLQRKKTAADLELLPGQVSEAQTQQQIQAATAPARVQAASKIAEDELLRQNDFPSWVAKQTDKKLIEDYTTATGSPPPKTLRVKNPERPLTYDQWLNQAGPIIQQAQMEFKIEHPNPTPEQEDEYIKNRDAKLAAKYHEYEQRALAPIDAPQGSEEYAKELQKQVQKLRETAEIHGARVKALPNILENGAKGGAAPHKTVVKRINSAGQEEEVLVQTDPLTGEKLGETVLSTTAPKLSEVQANTQLFANRMGYNDKVLTGLEQKGFDPTSIGTTAQSFLPNRFKADEVQQYNAAKNNWISAVLRKESGAAISANEYKQADKEYFPQDGDSPTVVQQKQGLRKYAEEQLHKLSGPGGQNPAPAAAPAPVPFAGSKRVVQNGVTFEWNGTTYIPVSPTP